MQRLEDLQAINQLFIDYGEHLDAGDFDAYVELFADDGEVLLGPMGRATGRAEIKALMTATLGDNVGSTYHIVSSPRVELDGDLATATVMWSVAVVGRRWPCQGHDGRSPHRPACQARRALVLPAPQGCGQPAGDDARRAAMNILAG